MGVWGGGVDEESGDARGAGLAPKKWAGAGLLQAVRLIRPLVTQPFKKVELRHSNLSLLLTQAKQSEEYIHESTHLSRRP